MICIVCHKVVPEGVLHDCHPTGLAHIVPHDPYLAGRIAALEGELAKIKSKRCQTCKHCGEDAKGYRSGNWLRCKLHNLPCSNLYWCCGAWERSNRT